VVAYVIIGLYVEISYEFYNISKTLSHDYIKWLPLRNFENMGVFRDFEQASRWHASATKCGTKWYYFTAAFTVYYNKSSRGGEGDGEWSLRENPRGLRGHELSITRTIYSLIETAVYAVYVWSTVSENSSYLGDELKIILAILRSRHADDLDERTANRVDE